MLYLNNKSMNFVNKLEKSRGVILEMLELRGFDTSKYTNYSLTEIDIMYKNSPKGYC